MEVRKNNIPSLITRCLLTAFLTIICFVSAQSVCLAADYGDVSKNGEITAYDAALTAEYSVGLIEFDSEQLAAADVTGNGEVSAFDASLIARRVVDPSIVFPVEQLSHPRLYFNSQMLLEMRPRISANRDFYSYLKNIVDNTIDQYNTNRELIVADFKEGFPQTRTYITAFYAVISQEQKYIDATKDLMGVLLSIGPEEGWDRGTRNRVLSMAIIYDWLYEHLNENEKQALRNSMYSHILYIDGEYKGRPGEGQLSKPEVYYGAHARWGNAVALAASMAVKGEDSRFDKYFQITHTNWVEGYNPVLEYGGKDGGHWMGWSYGPAYSSPEPSLIMYPTTGQIWNREFLHDVAFFYIYPYTAHPSSRFPYFGDMTSGTLWEDAYEHLGVASGLLKNPYAEDIYRKWTADNKIYVNYQYRIFKLIYDDPALQPKPIEELPLARHFSGSGYVVARNTWTDDAAIFTFRSAPFYAPDHNHRAQNSFTVDLYGPLLIDSGDYDLHGTDHYRHYYVKTIAHNSLVVYDPDENMDYSNCGGQYHLIFPRTVEDLKGDFAFDGIEKYSNTAECAYVHGNATKAYRAEKLQHYSRDVVYINKPLGLDFPVIYVLDNVKLAKQLTPRILWQLPKQPTINSNYALIKNDTGGYGRLEFETDKAVSTISGRDKWKVDGTIYPPRDEALAEQRKPHWGRIELSTPGPVTDAVFSTVIVLDDSEVTTANIPLSVSLEGTGWKGAKFNSTFVAVAYEDISEINIQETGVAEVYLGGLTPGSTCSLVIGTDNYQLVADQGGLATLKIQ